MTPGAKGSKSRYVSPSDTSNISRPRSFSDNSPLTIESNIKQLSTSSSFPRYRSHNGRSPSSIEPNRISEDECDEKISHSVIQDGHDNEDRMLHSIPVSDSDVDETQLALLVKKEHISGNVAVIAESSRDSVLAISESSPITERCASLPFLTNSRSNFCIRRHTKVDLLTDHQKLSQDKLRPIFSGSRLLEYLDQGYGFPSEICPRIAFFLLQMDFIRIIDSTKFKIEETFCSEALYMSSTLGVKEREENIVSPEIVVRSNQAPGMLVELDNAERLKYTEAEFQHTMVELKRSHSERIFQLIEDHQAALSKLRGNNDVGHMLCKIQQLEKEISLFRVKKNLFDKAIQVERNSEPPSVYGTPMMESSTLPGQNVLKCSNVSQPLVIMENIHKDFASSVSPATFSPTRSKEQPSFINNNEAIASHIPIPPPLPPTSLFLNNMLNTFDTVDRAQASNIPISSDNNPLKSGITTHPPYLECPKPNPLFVQGETFASHPPLTSSPTITCELSISHPPSPPVVCESFTSSSSVKCISSIPPTSLSTTPSVTCESYISQLSSLSSPSIITPPPPVPCESFIPVPPPPPMPCESFVPPPPPPVPFESLIPVPPPPPMTCESFIPPPPPPPIPFESFIPSPPPVPGACIPPPPPPPVPGACIPPPPPPPSVAISSPTAYNGFPAPPSPSVPLYIPVSHGSATHNTLKTPTSPGVASACSNGPPFPANPFNRHQKQNQSFRKPVIKPKSSMRPLYWTRIQISPVTDPSLLESQNPKELTPSFWSNLEEVEVCLEIDEFDLLFSRPLIKPKSKSETIINSLEKSQDKKKKPIKLLSSKRSQNIGIFIRSNHLEISDIENIAYNLDNSVLEFETLMTLRLLQATMAEAETIRSFVANKPDAILDKPEKFLLELDSITCLNERLECFMFQTDYNNALSAIECRLNNVKHVCDHLMKGEGMKHIFGTILACGNYMNGGNMSRGQADGFDIDILPKLKDVKSQDNQMTLLQYIVRHCTEKFDPNKGTIHSVLPIPDPSDIEMCQQIDFDRMRDECHGLNKRLNAVRDLADLVVQKSDSSHVEPFSRKMNEFFSKAEKSLTELTSMLNECLDVFVETMVFYKYKAQGSKELVEVSPNDFFCCWYVFAKDYKTAWKKEQMRLEKMAAREKRIWAKETYNKMHSIDAIPIQTGGLKETMLSLRRH